MSELVRKVHSLKRDVFDLEQTVLEWKSNYAAEVNHAEELAHMLGHLHLPCSKAICSICNLLDIHDKRRRADMSQPNPGPSENGNE